MRQIYPEPVADIDPVGAYGRLETGRGSRPAVRFNMITSLDGATALSGRSGAMSGQADRSVFSSLRALADVILVGAGTMRTEGYGPAKLGAKARERRSAMGIEPVPPIAVMTRSCALDWGSRFFVEAEERPIVVTTASATETNREHARAVADVVIAGDDEVDPLRAIEALGDRGAQNVLVEGGPGINGEFARIGLIDELCLTLSPLLVGEGSLHLLGRLTLNDPIPLALLVVLESDGFLFLRYGRSDGQHDDRDHDDRDHDDRPK